MKGRQWILPPLLLALFLLIYAPCQPLHAKDKGEKDVLFRWAFGAMVGAEGDRRLVAITRDTTLKTGDKLKMLIELQNRCFIYLFYRTGEDELYLLFPYEPDQFEKDYGTLKKYYIPQGDMWFELDEKQGLETFYLLASAERLTELENLYGEYVAAEASRKKELGKQILKKIRAIKKQNRKLTTTAERPVPIGGNLRGAGKGSQARLPDIDPIAAEVSASHFYSRTFTIDHR
jgi:hypothetical protein